MKGFLKNIYTKLANRFSRIWVANNIYKRTLIIKFSPRTKADDYFYIGTDEVVNFPLPKNKLDNTPLIFKKNSGLFANKKRWIEIYNNCTILGRGVGLVLDKNKKILWNATIYQLFSAHQIFFPIPFFRQKYFAGSKKIDRAIFLRTNWSDSYSHWLFEILARLEFLEKVDRPNEIVLIVEANLKSWQKQTLYALGFQNPIVALDSSNIEITNLYIPDFPPQEIVPHRQQSLWLRDRILASTNLPTNNLHFSKRILILRQKYNGRFFSEEKKLIRFLAQYGFEALYLEQLSFAQQIKLFAQLEIVIAPHGAGLSNLIFSKDTKVIEVFQANDIRHQYFLLSGMMGFEYYFLAANEGRKKASIQVDQKELMEILNPILDCIPT